ncbi:MAG: glycosyltransferase family 4 protein [Acidobacteriota bacterium]
MSVTPVGDTPVKSFGGGRAREGTPFSPKGVPSRILRPLNLLLLNYEYPPIGGGAGNATANMARELAGLGHRVRVVTAAFAGQQRREAVDGFEIWRIPAVRRHADHCSPLEMLTFLASASVALPIMQRTFRADACICFFGIPCGPAAWLLKALCGVPYVVSLRGGDVPGFQPYDLAGYHRVTGPLIRFLWRGAAGVVANSQGLAALARKTAGQTPIAMIPNGVDTARFFPGPTPAPAGQPEATAKPDGSGPVRLLFVGRVVHQKGLDVLLAALAELPSGLKWSLDIVGDGPLRPALAEQAARLGLAGRVRFAGWATREAMPDILRAADLFVFASRDEGMPNAVLEAMASGLPVAATRISGNEELVLDGETGLLVPPDDVAALAGALGRLLGDRDLRRRLGAAGRERVVREYSWRSVAERYAALCAGAGE